MEQDLWRARLGKSICLLIVALAVGCTGTKPTPTLTTLPAGPEHKPQIIPPPTEAAPAGDLVLTPIAAELTVLERLARAEEQLAAQRERNEHLEKQLLAEKARSAQLEQTLGQQTQSVDRLQRQLADMEQAIEDVSAEAAAAEGLRPQLLVLQTQLDLARAEVTARKTELLQLTAKLEDIYRVLIREFEKRSDDEVIVRPQ